MKKKGTVLMAIGLLLIAAALCLVIHNYRLSEAAGESAEQVLEALAPIIEENRKNSEAPVIPEEHLSVPKMMTAEVDGYLYIGVLDIPDLSISLPVMADWDYDRLEISPCLYRGSYYTDDLVICGHNYRKHFSPLKSIDIGTDVYFTAADGAVYHYIVSNRETVQPTEIERMIDSCADWDLTLFTCNTSGLTRCAVRCDMVR